MDLSVSVALCTYNGERFVADQVRSILAQSVLPHEIVVSDDGSTDDTVRVVERTVAAAAAQVSVRYLRGAEPLGVTRNFERAIRATTGDLVMLSDQDDVWHVDRVALALADFADRPDLLLWHGDARLVDETGNELGYSLFDTLGARPDEIARVNTGEALAQYVRRNLVTGATTVFRRSLLEPALPFPPEWIHDEWLGAIAAATGEVHASSAKVIDYRQHSSNEIGAVRPTLARKVRRMLEPRDGRYVRLAARAEALVARLDEIGAPASSRELAVRKRDFEAVRAGYPRSRIARVPSVLAGLRRGSYAELSSQGDLDALRDVLHPAGRQPAGAGATE